MRTDREQQIWSAQRQIAAVVHDLEQLHDPMCIAEALGAVLYELQICNALTPRTAQSAFVEGYMSPGAIPDFKGLERRVSELRGHFDKVMHSLQGAFEEKNP